MSQIPSDIAAHTSDLYYATPEELKAIDEALEEIEHGEIATDEEVEAMFAKYRRA